MNEKEPSTVREAVEMAFRQDEEKAERERQRKQDIDEVIELYRNAKQVGYVLPLMRWILRWLPKFPKN